MAARGSVVMGSPWVIIDEAWGRRCVNDSTLALRRVAPVAQVPNALFVIALLRLVTDLPMTTERRSCR